MYNLKMNYYLWILNTSTNKITPFKLIKNKKLPLSCDILQISIDDEYIVKSNISIKASDDIESMILSYPSTNGLYAVPATVTTKINEEHKTKMTILISTDDFMKKYINDKFISTVKSDYRYFFNGKNISPKLFIKKHLQRFQQESKTKVGEKFIPTYESMLNSELNHFTNEELKGVINRFFVFKDINATKREKVARITNIFK